MTTRNDLFVSDKLNHSIESGVNPVGFDTRTWITYSRRESNSSVSYAQNTLECSLQCVNQSINQSMIDWVELEIVLCNFVPLPWPPHGLIYQFKNAKTYPVNL